MRRYSRGKTRGGRVGGFPEPERLFGGSRSPKGVARKVLLARKVLVARLRGKSCRRGRAYRRGRDCLRGEN